MLTESDLNQTIPVHELLGAHVQRLKQLERQRRREAEAQYTTQPVRTPLPRPSCTLGDITLAVSKFGRRRVVRPVRLPPEDEDMVLLRELARRRRVTSDSFERVDICKTMNHIQRRVKRREMELQAERIVESARLPKWQLGAGGHGPLRETEHGEEAISHGLKAFVPLFSHRWVCKASS